MKSTTSITIIIVALIIGGVILFTNQSPKNKNSGSGIGTTTSGTNVSIVDGVQIIELAAKGGYSPRRSVAQAGVPTVIRFNTLGTFDCSLAVRIPSLNLNKYLSQTGSTDIDIGTPKAGIFRGSCGMGMYPFEVDFR